MLRHYATNWTSISAFWPREEKTVSARRQIQPEPNNPAQPDHPDTSTHGERVNRLFQDAIRDLEALKQVAHHKPNGRTRPA